jgi:hypothetical protein
MKRREVLTVLAAAPLAGLAIPAVGQEKKKTQPGSAESGSKQAARAGEEEEEAEACAQYTRSVDDVDLIINKQGMMYMANIIATVIVPAQTENAEYLLTGVTACVERVSDHLRWGPITLTKDAFSGDYVHSTPLYLSGATAGQEVIAKVLAIYQLKVKGASETKTLS